MLQSYSCLLGHHIPPCRMGRQCSLLSLEGNPHVCSVVKHCASAMSVRQHCLHRSLLSGGSPVGVPRKTALGILVSNGPARQLPRHCRLACLHNSTAWPIDKNL